MDANMKAIIKMVKEMDKVLSETQNLTIDGQPMEASDDHFKTQTKNLQVTLFNNNKVRFLYCFNFNFK